MKSMAADGKSLVRNKRSATGRLVVSLMANTTPRDVITVQKARQTHHSLCCTGRTSWPSLCFDRSSSLTISIQKSQKQKTNQIMSTIDHFRCPNFFNLAHRLVATNHSTKTCCHFHFELEVPRIFFGFSLSLFPSLSLSVYLCCVAK